MPELSFDRRFDAPYGKCVQVSPLIRRMLACNPGPFTFKGTSVAFVGRHKVAVIDPGPDDSAHLESLQRVLPDMPVSHILVTHTHRDHSPAARHLREWTGAPVYGFGPHGEEGAAGLEEGADRDFAPDVRLRDGDLIEGDGFTLQAIHTPGHTSNHLCYALREEQALFSGDHVMAWSTTVVAPPDGDMAAYMHSLEKLLRRDESIYWPTHGGAIREPRAFVSALLGHRLAREAEVMAAIRSGQRQIPEIAARIYRGLDARLVRAASLNVLAHLNKLVKEGRVRAEGEGADATYVLAERAGSPRSG